MKKAQSSEVDCATMDDENMEGGKVYLDLHEPVFRTGLCTI